MRWIDVHRIAAWIYLNVHHERNWKQTTGDCCNKRNEFLSSCLLFSPYRSRQRTFTFRPSIWDASLPVCWLTDRTQKTHFPNAISDWQKSNAHQLDFNIEIMWSTYEYFDAMTVFLPIDGGFGFEESQMLKASRQININFEIPQSNGQNPCLSRDDSRYSINQAFVTYYFDEGWIKVLISYARVRQQIGSPLEGNGPERKQNSQLISSSTFSLQLWATFCGWACRIYPASHILKS